MYIDNNTKALDAIIEKRHEYEDESAEQKCFPCNNLLMKFNVCAGEKHEDAFSNYMSNTPHYYNALRQLILEWGLEAGDYGLYDD